MGGRAALLALAAALLAVVGVAALAAFFVSRDEATVPQAGGPGTVRAAGAQPAVKPGNVVLLHSDERLSSDLRALAERIAGAPSPALVDAGQAVLVERRANLAVPVTAVTATRELRASGPRDPALQEFVEYWLGRTP
ncbi:MAG TPA: hypothetical protein VG474_05475 [Solirubrobacteraceae bacterium]|nr:hypothetical protein [Solirubrobacteraceae bacterium]